MHATTNLSASTQRSNLVNCSYRKIEAEKKGQRQKKKDRAYIKKCVQASLFSFCFPRLSLATSLRTLCLFSFYLPSCQLITSGYVRLRSNTWVNAVAHHMCLVLVLATKPIYVYIYVSTYLVASTVVKPPVSFLAEVTLKQVNKQP